MTESGARVGGGVTQVVGDAECDLSCLVWPQVVWSHSPMLSGI